ncbi:YncE family protein [Serratia sp. M24T3]|uniref:7-bladed beta-propeller protein YncE n=1 Tax=Serratia sp. M24T3 TaxID=932213 RepID=UPI00025B9BE2|nr:YncE family protein [Serratia sp. M24T3]EIC84105.1 putative receptor [Serratia sp. M24T3]
MSSRFTPAKKGITSALLLTSVLFSTSPFAEIHVSMERKAVDKGVYELAYSADQKALFVASSQGRQDKSGALYRLDPSSLAVSQSIKTNLKPFGVALNSKTDTVFLGNTTSSAVTSVDAKTNKVLQELVLDNRPRTEKERPLAPRELVVDEATNTLYVGGLGKESVIWVVDGANLTLRHTIEGAGKMATGLAIDAKASRLYITNADGEFLTVDTKTDKILSRVKIDNPGEHFYLNISLDTAKHRAFVTDSKEPSLLVLDTENGKIIHKIAIPASLAVLFNPARNEVYVTHRDAGNVSVIDATSYKVLETLDIPTHPQSLAISDDGQTLYVSVKQESSRQKEATAPDEVVRVTFK